MKINLIAKVNGTMTGLCYTAEKVITIGRETGNTIAALASDSLSRKHAKIYEKDGKWFVEDLGSMNGTYRLGEKLTAPVELKVRDVLQFGNLEIVVDDIGDGQNAEPAVAAPVAAPVPPVSPVAELKPVAPATPAKPAEPAVAPAAPAAPVAPAIVPAAAPVKPVEPVKPVKPAAPAAVPVAPAAGIKRPVIGGAKPMIYPAPNQLYRPGLKLPPKPAFGAKLKLPPKPGAAPAAPAAPAADGK